MHFFNIQVFKKIEKKIGKKKKDQPTDPSNFQAKRANKPYFLCFTNLSFCLFLLSLLDILLPDIISSVHHLKLSFPFL